MLNEFNKTLFSQIATMAEPNRIQIIPANDLGVFWASVSKLFDLSNIKMIVDFIFYRIQTISKSIDQTAIIL